MLGKGVCITAVFVVMTGVVMTMLPCCDGPPYADDLIRIDGILQRDPDSAYRQLCDYDTARLKGERDINYYRLLMAEARCKTSHGDTAECEIGKAASYFLAESDKRNAMRSLLYKGRIFQKRGDYGPAIITLLESAEEADTAEHLYLGEINMAISESYMAVSDARQQLEYARIALDQYEKLDSLTLTEDSRLWLGLSLCRNNQFNEGVGLMNNVYADAVARKDDYMIRTALINLSRIYHRRRDYARVKDCLSALYSRSDSIRMPDYCLRLYLIGMVEAGSPADSIEEVAGIMRRRGEGMPHQYYVYKGDYDRGYKTLLRVSWKNDSVYADRLNSNVAHSVNMYMNEKQQESDRRIVFLSGRIRWMVVSVVLSACLFVIVAYLFVLSRKKREKDILYAMEVLIKEKSEVGRRIDSLNVEISGLRCVNESLRNKDVGSEHIKSKDFGAELIIGVFDNLDSLHSEYYMLGNTDKGKNALLRHISGQIKSLREDEELLRNMEGFVDSVYGNLLSEVCGGLKLNLDQRRLVVFRCLNLSKEAICQIFGLTKENYYTRMNRLMKRIESTSSPRKVDLVSMMRKKEASGKKS